MYMYIGTSASDLFLETRMGCSAVSLQRLPSTTPQKKKSKKKERERESEGDRERN